MFNIDYDRLFNDSYKLYYGNTTILSKLSYKDKLDKILKSIKTDLSNLKIKVQDFKFVSLDKKELTIKTPISFDNKDKKIQKFLKQYKWQLDGKKAYKHMKNYVIDLTPKYASIVLYIDFKEFKSSLNSTVKKYEDLVPFIKNYLKTGNFEEDNNVSSVRQKVVKNILKPSKDKTKNTNEKDKSKENVVVKTKKQVFHIMISKNKGSKAFYSFSIKTTDLKTAKELIKSYAKDKGIKFNLIDVRKENEFKPKNIKYKNLDKYAVLKNTTEKETKPSKNANIKVKIDNVKENNTKRIKEVTDKKEKKEIKEKLKVQEPKVSNSQIKKIMEKTLKTEIKETDKSTKSIDKLVSNAVKTITKDFDKNDLKYYDNFKKLNVKVVDSGITKGWWQYNKKDNELLLSSKFNNNINILKNQLPLALATILAENYSFLKLENKTYYITKTQDRITKLLKDI